MALDFKSLNDRGLVAPLLGAGGGALIGALTGESNDSLLRRLALGAVVGGGLGAAGQAGYKAFGKGLGELGTPVVRRDVARVEGPQRKVDKPWLASLLEGGWDNMGTLMTGGAVTGLGGKAYYDAQKLEKIKATLGDLDKRVMEARKGIKEFNVDPLNVAIGRHMTNSPEDIAARRMLREARKAKIKKVNLLNAPTLKKITELENEIAKSKAIQDRIKEYGTTGGAFDWIGKRLNTANKGQNAIRNRASGLFDRIARSGSKRKAVIGSLLALPSVLGMGNYYLSGNTNPEYIRAMERDLAKARESGNMQIAKALEYELNQARSKQ